MIGMKDEEMFYKMLKGLRVPGFRGFTQSLMILLSTLCFLFHPAGCRPDSGRSLTNDQEFDQQVNIKKYNIRTGLIYRNPKPHVFSKQAYFPSVAVTADGEMIASFAIGEAFESANSDTYYSRSQDMGETWSEPVLLIKKDEKALVSNYARISALPGGSLAADIIRCHRESHPGEGLANPLNTGFVPTDLLIASSKDNGTTWGKPELIKAPLEGPSFEMCSPLVPLGDGRLLWPTSTWRGWDGYCPDGMKMIALVSYDNGRTWPEYFDIMNRSADRIIFWEGKVVELSGKLLLATAWAYDEANGKDLPNQYSLSRDGGKTWSAPASTGILAETMAIARGPEDKIIAVYRRMDNPGLWITVASLEGDRWINGEEIPLWGFREKSLTGKSGNMVQDFNELRFGAPCITLLPDKTVYVAFWCYEKMVSNIRWFKLTIK
jgi:sialidase-1